ncbi:MAG: hypothetical protein HC844_00905 [Tabrizicola sp.]|nr:hypothetical protein [Tabrizicola sp.]
MGPDDCAVAHRAKGVGLLSARPIVRNHIRMMAQQRLHQVELRRDTLPNLLLGLIAFQVADRFIEIAHQPGEDRILCCNGMKVAHQAREDARQCRVQAERAAEVVAQAVLFKECLNQNEIPVGQIARIEIFDGLMRPFKKADQRQLPLQVRRLGLAERGAGLVGIVDDVGKCRGRVERGIAGGVQLSEQLAEQVIWRVGVLGELRPDLAPHLGPNTNQFAPHVTTPPGTRGVGGR